ncbi:phage tail protein [Aeromonas hydrophila]|uniref:phage tail protein n=1 Tax=Aeromonas hydrophila TaxID=644 RepID=UPI001FF5E636|nr:phage tail protein [Aeromonas hydrophila]MCK0187873.1 phage tail protein [Aeromonas hydrophila]UOV94553.1 phage tail protein [Aeromonas hydrophila]
MADFKGYVTSVGQQFEALAKQMGYPVTIGFIEIGDGKLPDSESPINRTRLVNPLKQFPAIVEQDAKNPGQWVATCYIPADDAINGAGYMIREIGCKLINQGNGILYAYRRVSDDWKPADSSGEAKSFIYKLRFIPSNGELLTPTIDPSVVLVSKEELARVIKAHEDSRNHPDASELLKGFSRHATQAEVNDSAAASAAAVVTVKTLWGWVKQASENVLGMMKVASQDQVTAGTADDVAVTPKKLRMGFAMKLGTTGYFSLPVWMGSFIFQWGRFTVQTGTLGGVRADITFPIAYPTEAFVILADAGVSITNLDANQEYRLCRQGISTGVPTLTGVSAQVFVENYQQNTRCIFWKSLGR